MPIEVLIIDDEEKLRNLLSRIIARENYVVGEAGDFKTAFKMMELKKYPIILCDVKLPDGNGVDMIPVILSKYPDSVIILLTAYGNIPDGVRAIKNGAFDYITKGDDNDKILPLLQTASEKVWMLQRLKKQDNSANNGYQMDDIIGETPAIKAARDLADKVAKTDLTVLLMGETGTGKEVFAQSIHRSGDRRNKSFVALNCSTFSHEIMESELFGHVAGSFTGALKDKKGLVAEADGGTLFLDEIGELPLELQAKLLRLLETREYLRVGDTKPSKADFRLIAATNRNLKAESNAGTFRMDLYFRLNVFEIQLPPLRERAKDIPLLVQFIVCALAAKNNKPDITLSAEYMEVLQKWYWTGNIRELRNVLERSMVLANGNELTVETLPLEMIAPKLSHTQILSAFSLSSVEKLHIQKVLNYTKGNKAEAARLLEIGTATLYRKIDEYKL
ncbi:MULTISPECIES: sigma-54-dependent transcriptional regulator [Chitinophagaceae]